MRVIRNARCVLRATTHLYAIGPRDFRVIVIHYSPAHFGLNRLEVDMHDYEVVAGGVGSAYSGTSRKKARRAYRKNVELSLRGTSGVGSVTMFRDGVVVKEYDHEVTRLAIEVS